ncbi:glycopolymer--peptidoglycan transferase LytR [Streptococcus entericus]|uniref:glycopolymer--peptidoglycan transferase LytR n=1 Tax=Streptococcus entericus TaxID=155680 RepID=UPI0003607D07|nr:LCP family protein [Streptococcus entericus]
MSIGKKIALMLTGIITVTAIAVGLYLTTAYSFSTNELSKTFKNYRQDSIQSTAIADTKPFSVLLMGVDTGSGSREDRWQGQSDSMILVTVNPQTNTTTLTSLERDTLVDLLDETGEPLGTKTKLNAAYAYGGAPMAIKTVEGLMDIRIDYYMQINMQGLVDLVNAVGGITVTNSFDFPIRIDEWEPEYTSSVEPGTHKVNGDQALVYARMRYDDPEGDYGRQRRQREVIQKLVSKLLALNSLSSYRSILTAVSKNMQTDILLTPQTIPDLLAYRQAISNLQTYQLHGEDAMVDEVSYQAVTREHLLETQNRIKRELGLPENQDLTTIAVLYEDIYGMSPEVSTTYQDTTSPTPSVDYNDPSSQSESSAPLNPAFGSQSSGDTTSD